MRYSIIRRSAGVTVPLLLGHAFNYALFWGANRILDTGSFGLFYTAMLSINVLMAPMTAVMVVLARRFAEIGAKSGSDQVIALARHLLRLCLRAAPILLVISLIFAAAGRWFGIETWQIIVLIPLTVLALTSVEIVRTSWQGLLQFARASVLWIASKAISCSLAFGALLLWMKVWIALAGFCVGSILALLMCLKWYPGSKAEKGNDFLISVDFDLIGAMPMIVSYSLFILLNNTDILIGYLLLSRSELDVYAASALLPKAVITATFAVAQVVLPVVAEQRAAGARFRYSALKGLGLATFAAIVGAMLLWYGVPLLQQTPLAIRELDFSLVKTLAVGSVALSTLRVLLVVELALQRYAVGFAQAGAISLIAMVCIAARAGSMGIAELYTVTTAAFLCFGLAWLTVLWILERRDVMKARVDSPQIIDGTG